MAGRLKVGLIGAGVFAGYHANKLAAHPRVTFTGVTDLSVTAAGKLAQIHDAQVMTLKALLETSDAVVIASPATTHGEIAIQALRSRCHCLIEKPIATTAEEAAKIAALAASEKLIVQIGHQERLVLRAIGIEDVGERPVRLEAVRNSVYSPRGTDTSVTMDLMTHDIDLCTALMGQGPNRIEGEAGCVRSDHPDMSYARLSYCDATAYLQASRVAEQSDRSMKITYPSGVVNIDFNAKTLMHSTPFDLNENFGDTDIARDSLGAATDIFVRAVLDRTPVLVSAEDGAIAVRTAIEIDTAGQ